MKCYAMAVLAVCSMLAGCGYRSESPLEAAAYEGRTADLAQLIAEGADVQATNSRGLSALTAAARGGHVPALELLVAHGAAIDNPEGLNRWTPLMHAVHKRQIQSIEYLLSVGADARAHNSHALFMAAGYGDVEATLRLIDAGADPAAVSSDGSNALVAAVGGSWDIDASWPGCEPHTKIVAALLTRYPTLELPHTALAADARRFAEREGCRELISLLDNRQAAAR